jgi:hypothetical protein
MALIGTYGALTFECSRRRVHTFYDFKVSDNPRYAQHDVHLQTPILEFVGPGLTEVRFAMNLNRAYGVEPISSLTLLRLYSKAGVVAPLLIGNRPVILGFNLWVLTGIGEAHDWFSRTGSLQGVRVEVSLKEYRVLV